MYQLVTAIQGYPLNRFQEQPSSAPLPKHFPFLEEGLRAELGAMGEKTAEDRDK